MRNKFVLSVDIGTSAVKAVLFDIDLNQKGISRRSYPILIPQSGWSEQDPDVVLKCTIEAIAEVIEKFDKKFMVGIVLSCQMSSVLAVDPDGKPMTRILSWSDTRSYGISKSFQLDPRARQIYQVTGCPIEGIYPLSKIRWMIENNLTQSNTRFISIKDYLIFHLTGQFIADWSMASSTGLMDIRLHNWDPDALSLAGIKPENLSELVSPRYVIELSESNFLNITGIPVGTPLVIGAGDAPLSSLGVGALNPEILVVNVGTSTAARRIVSDPIPDPKQRLFTYVLDDTHWVTGGLSSSGGLIYEWFKNQFYTGSENKDCRSHTAFEELASSTLPGAGGLFFLPYLAGEQCPAWQHQTRGNFFGLDLIHTRGHLTRAVLEGITYSIFRIIETIQSVDTTSIKEVRVTGGLASSSLWQQIAADIFGFPLFITESTEGSARGGAILAWSVLGYLGSLQNINPSSLQKTQILPQKENHEFYMEQYQKFLSYIDCIKEVRS